MVREQADERQAYRRLRIQALVGRITTLAAGTAFLAAVAARITLWPFYIFITVPGVTFLAGWLVYRDHPGTGDAAGRR
jgi:fatty acid desaturase